MKQDTYWTDILKILDRYLENKEYDNTEEFFIIRDTIARECASYVREQLQAQRHQLIAEVEKLREFNDKYVGWLEPREQEFGYNQALDDVLAALKKGTHELVR